MRTGRKFEVLAVGSLDLFGRSMQANLATVLELDRVGVQVVSVKESFLNTSGPVPSPPHRLLGWLAQQERERLIERTKAGLERARRQGRRIGRPKEEVRNKRVYVTLDGVVANSWIGIH